MPTSQEHINSLITELHEANGILLSQAEQQGLNLEVRSSWPVCMRSAYEENSRAIDSLLADQRRYQYGPSATYEGESQIPNQPLGGW